MAAQEEKRVQEKRTLKGAATRFKINTLRW
jgi:hypothetical protein